MNLLKEALKDASTAACNATVYTNIASSTSDLLNNYSTILENFIKNNRVVVYSIEKHKKKKLNQLIDSINGYSSLFKLDNPSLSMNSILHSFSTPISKPLENTLKSMDAIYSGFKHIGIDVPKFVVLDSDLSDDIISLYGIFATNENKKETSERLKEIEGFMQEHGISIPSTNVKNFSLDDFFSDIGKFKLDHSNIQKGKFVASRPEGDYYDGTYTKNDESIKVTIMELNEFNLNLENFRREVTSLSSITHPNIIEFIGATSSPPYMILTARHGHTLRYYIQKVKKDKEISKKPSDFLFEAENDQSTNSEKDKKSKKKDKNHKSYEGVSKQPSSFTFDDVGDECSSQKVIKKVASSFSYNDAIDDVDADNDKKAEHHHKHRKDADDTESDKKKHENKKHKKKLPTGTEKSIIAYKIAEAMAYVHSKNIMHRNLSCATVVLDSSMNPFIVDFGTSRLLPEDESFLLTIGVGTERVKAPELTSDTRYGHEIDVFSYGMMLYEMLTNSMPFEQMTPAEASSAILSGKRPKIPSNTPEKLSSLITRCWSPNAKDRPTFIQLVNEIPYSKVMFPGCNEAKVLHFYRSVSVKSANIQYCIDFMEQICDDIDEIIIFKHEAVRIRALLCGYILALKKSNIGKNSDEEQFEIATDVSNLMDSLQRLSIGIKNITSPTWENHALTVPATAPIDDINESLDCLAVPLAQLGLNVEKYKPNKVDLALDFRILYSTFKSNDSIGNPTVQKRIKEVENFMKKNKIEIAPSQQEIDERISSVFKNYENYIVKHSDFEKVKLIGNGATSDVYLGTQKSTGNKVAIKEFTEDYLLAEKCGFYLHREIAALSTLRHEYLANFIGTTKSNPIWMISEYVENGDLESHIEKGNLSPFQKTVIMYEVAEGMAYLHSMKMIHRDLKTKNVLLDSNLEPKIVDFGFTRPFSATMSVAVGTPIYMAPEVIQSSYYDYTADVFSFALMISEMITGFKPFLQYCSDPLTIQQYILDGLRPNFNDDLGVSDDLKDLLEEMWDGDYKKRPGFNTILGVFRKKRIAFPGANQEDIDKFYDEKENKVLKSPHSLKRKTSLLLQFQQFES